MPFEYPDASITLDFAKRAAAGPAVETFEREHTEDLAGGGTYTPAVSGFFSTSLETSDMEIEVQTTGGWMEVVIEGIGFSSIIGDGTNLRFGNNNAAARELVVMRHHLSTATYVRYSNQDLAAGTSYTPGDEGLFSHGSEGNDVKCEYKYNANWYLWGTYNVLGSPRGTSLGIGDGTNMRYRNNDGVNARWLAVMRTVMA